MNICFSFLSQLLKFPFFCLFKLSFRSATACLDKIRDQMRRILQLRVSSAVAKEMENAFNTYMRRACDTFDLEKNVEVS